MYSFLIACVILGLQSYNIAGPVCWIAVKPSNCLDDPDVECISRGTDILKWVAAGGPFFFVFFANCMVMLVLWWTEYSTSKRSADLRVSWIGTGGGGGASAVGDRPRAGQGRRRTQQQRLRTEEFIRANPLAARLSRPSPESVRRQRAIVVRATSFITGFIFTYLFAAIYRVMEVSGNKDIPFVIVLLSRITFPMQGIFNIMIYTYPHITTYRNRHPEDSWTKAFFEVVKEGGNNDDFGQVALPLQHRRRCSSILTSRSSGGVGGNHNENGTQLPAPHSSRRFSLPSIVSNITNSFNLGGRNSSNECMNANSSQRAMPGKLNFPFNLDDNESPSGFSQHGEHDDDDDDDECRGSPVSSIEILDDTSECDKKSTNIDHGGRNSRHYDSRDRQNALDEEEGAPCHSTLQDNEEEEEQEEDRQDTGDSLLLKSREVEDKATDVLSLNEDVNNSS